MPNETKSNGSDDEKSTEEVNEKEKKVEIILDAIETVQNAISIFMEDYDHKLDSQIKPNYYGIALSEF